MSPSEPFKTVRGDDWICEWYRDRPSASARLDERKAAGHLAKMRRGKYKDHRYWRVIWGNIRRG